jgi:hypothetical protein
MGFQRRERPAGKNWCAGCKAMKPVSAFSRNRALWNGLQCYCKKCRARHKREREERLADLPDTTARVRFDAKIKILRTGCWIWRGALDQNGHGAFLYQGKTITAHIAACHIYTRDVAKHLSSYQTCHVPPCVNPAHVAFCTRRELSMFHARDNPFARNARQELCTSRQHPLEDGKNILYIVSNKGIGRLCLDCWLEQHPGSKRVPNTREDAEAQRYARLMAFLGTHIPANTPTEMRTAMLAELWARWKTRKVKRATLERVTAEVVRSEWQLRPDRFGAPASLDALVPGSDDLRWIDQLPDESEESDPLAILERREAGGD